MNPFFQKPEGEKGSVLVVALLILVLLTMIGISANTDTDIETQIAGNDKFHKIAFYNADSGIYPSAKLISSAMDTQTEPSSANITYLGSTGTFLREVMGYDSYDTDRDIRFTPSSFPVNVDVNRTGAKSLVGGGVEFSAGAEGIGSGSGGGVAVFYNINSLGNGPVNSESNVVANYRKVVGVPGGL